MTGSFMEQLFALYFEYWFLVTMLLIIIIIIIISVIIAIVIIIIETVYIQYLVHSME